MLFRSDLGCIFSLAVDDAGAAHLSVATGWVNLQNPHGNTFVPAGASASMIADDAPEVPVYDDAPLTFGSSDFVSENDFLAAVGFALQYLPASYPRWNEISVVCGLEHPLQGVCLRYVRSVATDAALSAAA